MRCWWIALANFLDALLPRGAAARHDALRPVPVRMPTLALSTIAPSQATLYDSAGDHGASGAPVLASIPACPRHYQP